MNTLTISKKDAKVDSTVSIAAAKRTSRLPIAQVLGIMKSAGPSGMLVSAIAEKVGGSKEKAIPERDVRLVIDKLRAQKHRIVRSALKTFTYVGGPVEAAK